jgi:hypothetical protein
VIAKKGGYALMQELHFTKRDIRLRIAEGKRLFWQRLDGMCKDTVRVLLEEGILNV